jgi:hypothetical protein
MLPKAHILLGIPFALVCLYLFPQIGLLGAGIIFLSSFLIDVDHYIYYVLAEKRLSLFKAYNWHFVNRQRMKQLSRKERKKHKNEILFLHGLEPLIILYFLSFLWQSIIFIVVGFSFHLFVDILDHIVLVGRLDKVSVIWDIVKFKKLKKLDIINK